MILMGVDQIEITGENMEGKEVKRARAVIYYGITVLIGLFLFFYVRMASVEIVYSDYIRLIHQYLPDTLASEKFFVPDILTRIPITYLFRFINIKYFHYLLAFDRTVGVIGFLLFAFVITRYCLRVRMSFISFLLVSTALASLDKWERLLHGSGYPHLLSYALFAWGFYLFEKEFTGTAGQRDRTMLTALPFLSLLTAGPYIVQFSMTLLVGAVYVILLRNRNMTMKRKLTLAIVSILPLLLFMWSNHYAVYSHSGASDVTLGQLVTEQPGFLVHFILNGFAAELFGGSVLETWVTEGSIGYSGIYVIGAMVLLSYLLALFLYFRSGMYQRTVFPLLLMMSGVGSHALVLFSRYIFLNETYAWSSRYALQYLPGKLAVLLIFGELLTERFKNHKKYATAAGVCIALTFGFGACYTTVQEFEMAAPRKMYFETLRDAALHLDQHTNQELSDLFEYHHGEDDVRVALEILEEYHLNVYYEPAV